MVGPDAVGDLKLTDGLADMLKAANRLDIGLMAPRPSLPRTNHPRSACFHRN